MNEIDSTVFGIAVGIDGHGRTRTFVADQAGILCHTGSGVSSSRVWSGAPASAIATSPGFANDGLVLAGIAGGVVVSHDFGVSWTTQPIPDLASPVASIAIDDSVAGQPVALIATLEDGVFRCDAAGPWLPSNAGLYLFRTNVIRRDGNGIVWLGTDGGVFHSEDGGLTWRDEPGSGLDAEITAIATVDDLVAIGTASGEVWWLPRPGGVLVHLPLRSTDSEIVAIDLSKSSAGPARVSVVSATGLQQWAISSESLDQPSLVWSHRHPAAITCATFAGAPGERLAFVGTASGMIDRIVLPIDSCQS